MQATIQSKLNHNSIDPSWLDQEDDILYGSGSIELELKKIFFMLKSEIINPIINNIKASSGEIELI